MKNKLVRISTVPISLNYLLKGQLCFLNQYFEVIAVSGDDEHLYEVADREKVRIVPINMQRSISPFQDIVSLWKLYRFFRKERPQIVHSITPKAGLLSMIAAKISGVPIRIHTFTGLIFPSKTGLMKRVLIVMDQLLCWAATNIYPEGKGVKQDLINYRITSKPLKVLANGNVNGIDLDFFSIDQIEPKRKDRLKQHLSILPNDFVFVFVGRLVGDKGINELVKAFSQLEINNVKLLLVGPFEKNLDPLKAETYSLIENNPNIINVGFQSDVRPYFKISNCLVFPSYREGFPNVVMQAGAMGLPCIVTNINGCNEIINDEENGLIIPTKDVKSLSKSMVEISSNQDLYKTLKKNSRKMIESRFEQKMVWKAILEEYKSLI